MAIIAPSYNQLILITIFVFTIHISISTSRYPNLQTPSSEHHSYPSISTTILIHRYIFQAHIFLFRFNKSILYLPLHCPLVLLLLSKTSCSHLTTPPHHDLHTVQPFLINLQQGKTLSIVYTLFIEIITFCIINQRVQPITK